MLALIKKEIRSFLSSLTGYLVVIVFLLITGLFLWVFPGTDFNMIDNGYASLETFFVIAPWVFMFLIPAVTMRSFSEEKKSGTIEILYTRPLGGNSIIISKYIAGFMLVIFSLIPTLIYYWSVYELSIPQGNIDHGGTWGSYAGLLFLAGGFCAIGIFASSVSGNQIISFILALFLSFFCYMGFSSVSSLLFSGKADLLIETLGINAHYLSMSRGVLELKDIIYFISLIIFFLLATKTVVNSRKW